MVLSPQLELRQTQSLVMTPQLMQAIKLLQLSNLELVAYVDQELERNPLLERDESEGRLPSEEAEPVDTEAGDRGDGADWLETTLEVSADAIAVKLDADLGNVFPDDHGTPPGETPPPPTDAWATPSRQAVSSEDYNLEAFVAEERTLAGHLAEQLGIALSDPTERLIGQALIDEIDEGGYLRADLAELAGRLGAPLGRVEGVLTTIQGFEPTGVGARSLKECLALQLRELGRLDPAMEALVEHLNLLAARDLGALRRACGVDDEDLAEMIAEIKALNPRPGAGYGSTFVQAVIPDVIVRAAPDGSWMIELNSETLPRVLVNNGYYATVARSAKGADRSYLAECLQTANWLIKSLDQRARTILKVAAEIVRQQDGFFAHGVEHLRPLNLKSIAEAIGMHESTVSRVTSNKYVATPRGIFELKYFFTSSIASASGGEAHSAEAVRHRIKTLIDREACDEILSDDTIVQTLRGQGIDIARRTVAKYREAMRIPSSVQRRREKQAGL